MPSNRTKLIAAGIMAAATITIYACMEMQAKADHCRVRNDRVVIQSTGAVVVPFAVPVAVPVQVATPYVYQHAGISAAQTDPDYAEFLRWKTARANQVKTQEVQSLVAQNCAKCHADNADAKEHIDLSGPLTDTQKLAAIAAVVSGKMPKSRKLDPQVRADIVAELSSATENSK